MTFRCRPSVLVIVVALAVGVTASQLSAQSATKPAVSASAASAATRWTAPRTPDGQPDLQGIWLNFDSTPFETPNAQPAAPAAQAAAGANVGPASEFADHNHKVSKARRSMVIDPPDGRVPVMKWAEDKRDYDLAHLPDAPEHETPWVRWLNGRAPKGRHNRAAALRVALTSENKTTRKSQSA